MRYGNCLFWAVIEWNRAVYNWRNAGAMPGREPVLIIRPSRSRPRWVPHFLVAHQEHGVIQEPMSFKPAAPIDTPWYLAWTHFVFVGSVRTGDFPDTTPTL